MGVRISHLSENIAPVMLNNKNDNIRLSSCHNGFSEVVHIALLARNDDRTTSSRDQDFPDFNKPRNTETADSHTYKMCLK